MIAAVLVAAVLGLTGSAQDADRPAAGVPLAAVEVPGGAAALADAAGVDPGLPRARLILTIVRAIYELPEGIDRAADERRIRLREYVRALEWPSPGRGASDPDLVPLPLSSAAWDAMLGGRTGPSVLARVLVDRNAALLYYGLAALDATTASWFSSQPLLLKELGSSVRPALVAAFGRSVRIHDGRVQVPGGRDAEALWTALVGASPYDPSQFILRLFDADRGHLALFYDTLAHLAPGQLAFALGPTPSTPGDRRDRFERLYRESRRALAGFEPATRPFDRVAHDLAHVLAMTRTSPEGFPGGPASLELWRAALTRSGVPDNPRAELEDRNLRVPLDAADLVSLVGTTDAGVRRARSEMWFFGQRVFGGATERDYPDVLVALRAMGPYKALMLTLERMDIRAPATYVLAARQARRIEAIRDERQQRVEFGLFQGALAVLERARFSRTLDAGAAEALVASLCTVDASKPDSSPIAAWVERDLVPELERRVDAGVVAQSPLPRESLLLAAMSGYRADRRPGRTLEWEGLAYAVDPAAGELRRLRAIRTRQGGLSLDVALDLLGAASAAASAESVPALAAVRERLSDLREIVASVPVPADGRAGGPELLAVAAIEEARRRLERIRRPSASESNRVAREIRNAAESCLGAVLTSLAYAPHVGYPDSPVLLGGDPARFHDFGVGLPRSVAREHLAWQVPVEVRSRDTGWHLSGSVLGLDVALAALSLRRAMSETLPPPPAYREAERAALAEAAVLTNPFDPNAAARGRLVGAIRAGRSRLSDATGDPARLADLARLAGLDAWRANVLPWTGRHEPARSAELLSLAELALLGGAQDFAAGTLAASGWSLHAELRGVPLTWSSWPTLAGRKSTSLVPALVPDLALGIAEALDRLGVPTELGRGVLLMAAQDLLDSLRTNHDDDWMTLVWRAQRAAVGPVEDYVAGQTIWGALIPAGGSLQ